MGWWPFNSKSERTETNGAIENIDPELKKYSDGLVAQTNPSKKAADDYTAYREKFRISSTLQQAANHNCAEFATAYSNCISYGSFLNRSSGCNTQLSMFEKCQEMQAFALSALKYDSAPTDSQRLKLKALSDDLMIKAAPSLIITPEQEQQFQKLVLSVAEK